MASGAQSCQPSGFPTISRHPETVALLHSLYTTIPAGIMQSLLLLGLLGAQQASNVYAHPATKGKAGGLTRRTVDLNNFRLKATAQYASSKDTSSDVSLKFVKRDDYVSTATALVQKLAPGAEFRVVDDHYVGENGIAHVNFKQTVHGLDIDNADFNVNVRDLTHPPPSPASEEDPGG